MRLPGCSTVLSCAVLMILAGPAASQTLYLAQQEVDSSDPAAMDAAIARCAELAAASPDARIAAAFTHGQPAAPDPAADEASGQDQPVAQEPAADASDEDVLAAQDPAADVASADDGPEAQNPVPDTVPGAAERAIDPAALTLEADGAPAAEESAAPADAGEGEAEATGDAGAQAALAPVGSEDASEGIDLAAVTLESCKEAGLVY